MSIHRNLSNNKHGEILIRFEVQRSQERCWRMLTHQIHNQLLLKNVRVEVVYEDSPVFADEEVSAIVRFRHLGEKQQQQQEDSNNGTIPEDAPVRQSETSDGDIQQQGESNEENGWFGKRVSMQLSNAARSLFLEEAEQQAEQKPKLRNKSIDLLIGYIQLSGFFTYDEEVIDREKLKDFRNKAAVAGKIGGLEGLELSKTQNEGIFGSVAHGIGNFFNTTTDELEAEADSKKQELEKLIPFFSTSQSLLFSELNLKPGDVKTFYFKCKLPHTLPPSYNGSSIKINYHFIVGASLNKQIPKPLNIHFPLKIYPKFDEDGYQPTSNLDKFILLPSDKSLNEIVESSNGRRSSFKSIKKIILTKPKLSQSNKKEKFLNKIENLIENDENFNQESDFNFDEFQNLNNKQIISNFIELVNNNSNSIINDSKPISIIKEGYNFEKQISKIQSQFIIARNGQSITTLTFSKPFYTIGEEIKLTLDLQNKDLKTTGVLISLESIELIRDSFSADIDLTKTLPRIIPHHKESFSTFQTSHLPISINIPLSSTPQFKTNIFEIKWCLSLKFILSDDEFLTELHNDDTGSLKLGKENLSGTDFVCRLPITVLPSYKDFGGIIA
ncbi:Reduced growth phenotype protein 1 [Wickerhamomyces ciferrii]|uniref:Reduced growth phenotype protein 1 n=1 Tax=Wickerhamomyces ciferrii (strain ATCC 14091 / BCRC 22168 / CBS 111 / JCM 3599 / NBRC 0793 / NRRL Y-1031 F-60-10) TaxID=1206466 RepID=K0K9S7_WICCF|nr:Reduced growth phenotype protein 1 [Wickerhamomyces ciferrii]CCH41680.1 Reduced growth phenotype protein 1 [Wickerhamomyces ciferrii]